MTETNAADAATPQGEQGEQEPAAGHHQRDGRYIPYGGGSLGWYENSGVLRNERLNNYAFRTAMDGALVRAKQFERSGLHGEKRRSPRKVPSHELAVTLKSARDEQTARVLDLSPHGMKVTFIGDEIHLNPMEKVSCRFSLAKGGVLELECTVAHKEKSGLTRTVWNIGMDFRPMNQAQAAMLAKLGGFESAGSSGQ